MTDASDARAKAVREAARDDHSIGHHRILSCLFVCNDSMKEGRASCNGVTPCHKRTIGHHRILSCLFDRKDSMREGGAHRSCEASRDIHSEGCHRILLGLFGTDSLVEGGARRTCGALRHFRTIQATVSAPAAEREVVP